MRVRDWEDIVADVVDQNVEPDEWRAVAGDRAGGIGEDLYLGHPAVGMFHLKTYAKNPYQVQGVGTKVARKVDEDIGSYLPEQSDGRFAVRTAPGDEGEAEAMARRLEETVKAHADAPTTPDDLFSDMMEALDSPAYGPVEYDQHGRPSALSELATTFADAEEVLETEFEELVSADSVNRGFQ